MHRGRTWFSIVFTVALLSGAAHARDWGDILLEKGLITPQELERTRKEIEQSNQPATKTEAPVATAASRSPPPRAPTPRARRRRRGGRGGSRTPPPERKSA